jgi:hypothetical protein
MLTSEIVINKFSSKKTTEIGFYFSIGLYYEHKLYNLFLFIRIATEDYFALFLISTFEFQIVLHMSFVYSPPPQINKNVRGYVIV